MATTQKNSLKNLKQNNNITIQTLLITEENRGG